MAERPTSAKKTQSSPYKRFADNIKDAKNALGQIRASDPDIRFVVPMLDLLGDIEVIAAKKDIALVQSAVDAVNDVMPAPDTPDATRMASTVYTEPTDLDEVESDDDEEHE